LETRTQDKTLKTKNYYQLTTDYINHHQKKITLPQKDNICILFKIFQKTDD